MHRTWPIRSAHICPRPTPARSILDEIPAESDNGVRFMTMCLVVRSAESIGVAAYLTAVFAIIASEFKDSVTTAFVCNAKSQTTE